MIDFSLITKGLQTLLREHPRLEYVTEVARGEYINVDPALCTWIGVYRGAFAIEPRTLGRGADNWLARIPIDIVVQVNGDGGEDAETLLGVAVKDVLDVIVTDLTLGGTVDMVKEFSISYSYEKTASERLDFQWAIITLQTEVRSA